MNLRYPYGVLHSFSIKNILYDKMSLRLFYFHVTIYTKASKTCSNLAISKQVNNTSQLLSF